MDSSLENSLLFSDESDEEQFIKENLSFLLDPEEEFVGSVRFICREAQACVYKTSAVDSSVTVSWSIFSNGSLCSSKEKPSKFSSLYVSPNLFGALADFSVPESSSTLDLTFLTNALEGQTSTPIKNCLKRGDVENRMPLNFSLTKNSDFADSLSTSLTSLRARVRDDKFSDRACNSFESSYNLKYQFEGQAPPSMTKWSLGEPLNSTYSLINDGNNQESRFSETWNKDDALDLSLNSSWISHSNGQVSSLKNCTGNGIDHSGFGVFGKPLKVIKEAPIELLNEISKFNETLYEDVSEDESDSSIDIPESPKVCSKDSKPKSLTLADFMQKEVDEPKADENKENRLCKFCFKNGELPKIYASHETKTAEGVVVCPILRKYVCDLCGETGDKAHTRKYCPLFTERFAKKPFFRRLSNGILTTCHNHK